MTKKAPMTMTAQTRILYNFVNTEGGKVGGDSEYVSHGICK